MIDGSNEGDRMTQYARFVLTALSLASVRVRADGTIVFSLGERTDEFAPGGAA